MTSKTTKRALGTSLLAVFLCITMLLGSTFAWFTDNASTNVNTIQAGTLDIALVDAEGSSLEGKTLDFAKAAGAENEAVLFEPGAKYALTEAFLVNNGNLHAKYQVVVSGVYGSTELAKVLDVIVGGVNKGTLADLMANATDGVVATGTIAPGDKQSFGTVELMMQTTADNEYMGLSIEGIAVTVMATQDTVEHDSYNNTYDAAAEYDDVVNIRDQKSLNEVIANVGAPVTLTLSDSVYTLPNLSNKTVTISGTKNTVIDYAANVGANNADITFDGVTVKFANNASYTGFQHAAKVVYKDCHIIGQQTLYAPEVSFVNCTFENLTNDYCVWTYSATKVNFTGCTFNTSGKAILVYTEGETHAAIDVDNCVFNDDNGVSLMKAAVEVGSSPYSADTTYDIYMDGCTVNGFAVNDEGLSTGSTFWGNKNSMDQNHLNVVIDGIDVY